MATLQKGCKTLIVELMAVTVIITATLMPENAGIELPNIADNGRGERNTTN